MEDKTRDQFDAKLPQADDDGDGEDIRAGFINGDIGVDYSLTSKNLLS